MTASVSCHGQPWSRAIRTRSPSAAAIACALLPLDDMGRFTGQAEVLPVANGGNPLGGFAYSSVTDRLYAAVEASQ